MKLVFVHGWGSGTFMWDSMIENFANHECHIVNLGFLGEENIDLPDGKFVGIGHSLGGMWLLKHYPERMTGFVSIASFNCFYSHVPKQLLSMMQRNIAKDVTSQLKDFWHYAGLDQPDGFKNLKPLKLIEGLTWLSKWESNIPPDLPIKVLASRDDHIVPEKMSEEIWKENGIEWVNDGGHMLPITQADWCTTHITEFLKNEF